MINDPFASLGTNSPVTAAPKAIGGKDPFASLGTSINVPGVKPLMPTPSGAPVGSPTSLGPNAFKGSLGGGYGASNITDAASKKPLLTYENPGTQSSQLLADRTAPTFDPTKAQAVAPGSLQTLRMNSDLSGSLKAQFPGTSFDELDHIMPLELGGSNQDSNLRFEPGADPTKPYSSSANPTKTDPLENSIADAVHTGQISLADGWKQMATAKGIKLPEQGGPLLPATSKSGMKATAPDTMATEYGTSGAVALTGFPSTMQTLADLQTNPGAFGSSFKDIFSTPQGDVNKAGANFGTALHNFQGELSSDDPVSKKIGDTLSTVVAGAGFALSPLTSLFDAVSKVPVLGTVSKLVFNLPFSFAGDVGGDIGMGIINALPISQQAKDNLTPGVKAIYTLAGQIGLGAAIAPDVVGTLTRQFGAADAQTIVTKAQEMAAEKQATTPEIPPPPPDDPKPPEEAPPLTPETPKVPVEPTTPRQDTKTVDLSQPGTVRDILPPTTRTPMDALQDKFQSLGKPVEDIKAPETPVKPPTEEPVKTAEVPPISEESANPVVPRTTSGSLKEIPGTGKVTPYKLAASVLQSALESSAREDPEELPGSRSIDMADQAQKVTKLAADDPQLFHDIAFNGKAAPKGIIPEAVYKAAVLEANANDDFEAQRQLMNSPLVRGARTMGQRINALKGISSEDPTKLMGQLRDAKEAAYEAANKGKTAEGETKTTVKELKTRLAAAKPTTLDWKTFVESITC